MLGTEKFHNLYYEQKIDFKQKQRFLKLTKILFPYSKVCRLYLGVQIQIWLNQMKACGKYIF